MTYEVLVLWLTRYCLKIIVGSKILLESLEVSEVKSFFLNVKLWENITPKPLEAHSPTVGCSTSKASILIEMSFLFKVWVARSANIVVNKSKIV